MAALRIEEEQEHAALAQVVRLAVHGDGLRDLDAALVHRVIGEARSGNCGDSDQHQHGQTKVHSAARPPGRDRGSQHHSAILYKEHRTHGPLHPRETTAIAADQGVVVTTDVDHEHEQKRSGDPSAEAAVARKQDHKRHAELRGDQELLDHLLPAERISHFPNAGTQK